MKKLLMISSMALLFATGMNAQQKMSNEGAATETVVTTLEVNNGDEIKELTKEVTTKTEQALILSEKDKGKLNQDYKMGPTKITKTTIIKDGNEIVSKEKDIYYRQDNEKYVLESSERNITYNTAKQQKGVEKFQIKSESGKKCIGYFNKDGKLCEELHNETAGTMQQNIYIKEE